jgi:predicted TIM-barrel fold metal-dependent hydrolase
MTRLTALGIAALLSACAGTLPLTVPAYNGPIIDPHVHVFLQEEVAQSVHRDHVASRETVQRMFTDSRVQPGVMLMATGSAEATRSDNDALVAFTGNIPHAFAIGSVNPANGDEAVASLERMVKAGARWMKLHPNTQRFDVADPIIARLVARAGELGIPVTFDASLVLDGDQLGKFLMLAIQHPKTQLVLAHMGLTRFDEFIVLSTFDMYPWWQRNVWVDLSVIAVMVADSPRRDELLWTLRQIGMDRVLFASDFPANTPEEAIVAIERLGLTAQEKRAVFYDNAAGLLNMEADVRRARTTASSP